MTHPGDLLADHVSGSLTPSDRAAVEDHLSECPSCSTEVSMARAARSALRALPEVPAPNGAASRALDEAAASGGRPGWYRWLGAASVAAVVALLLISLPHLGSAPGEPEDAGAAFSGAAASPINSADAAMPLVLTVQQTDYDQAALDALTTATLQPAPSVSGIAPTEVAAANPTAKERAGSDAELQTALACVGKVVAPGAGPPVRLIRARFDGKASYLAFYYSGPSQSEPTSLGVWIVDSYTCSASGFSSARI